nr:KpsF/GutQ family sugar-phosphate isomerase [uncultured Cohaesibacter sp.]
MTQVNSDVLLLCKEALLEEAKAIEDFALSLGDEFTNALKLIDSSRDPVIVAGVGKSGHIARKIASTFRSVGKSAVFLHPAEASHGDLGLIGKNSTAIVLSNSGETSELSDLLNFCQLHSIPVVAITSSKENTLSRFATATIAYGNVKEACLSGLAPTTSTTLSLAIGDALTIGLESLMSFTPEDFRQFHPGGKLGRRLLRVEDLMHTNEALPLVSPEASTQELVISMSSKGFGVAVVAVDNIAKGVVTDGDMRRHIDELWSAKAKDLVSGPPLTVSKDKRADEALLYMNENGVTCLVVADEAGQIEGLIHIHDCVRAGVHE